MKRFGYFEVDEVALRNAMINRGTTMTDVSIAIGKSACYISTVMRKHVGVKKSVLEDIATLLEVDVNDLIAKPNTPFARSAFYGLDGELVDNSGDESGLVDNASDDGVKASEVAESEQRMKDLKKWVCKLIVNDIQAVSTGELVERILGFGR